MNEEGEIKASIEELARLTVAEYEELIAAGGTPVVVSFDNLFGKIMSRVTRDPRLTDMTRKSIRAHAEEAYREMSKKIGQSGMVQQDPGALRGLEIFVVVKEHKTLDTSIEIFADETQAVGTLNNWLRAMGVNVTAQQLQLWAGELLETRGPSPLFGTDVYGSRVMKCVIR